MKQFILFFLFCLALTRMHGQKDFYKAYSFFSNSNPPVIVQLPDSGYMVFSTYNSSDYDQALRRLDKNGNIVWAKKFTISTFWEEAGGMTLTANNQIVFSGYYNTNIDIVRIDLNGNFIFRKIFSGTNYPIQVLESKTKDIYVLCAKDILKVDSAGNFIWRKTYPVTSFVSMHELSGNKFILTGYNTYKISPVSNNDLFQMHIDSSGAVQSQKSYGTNSNESAQASVMLKDKVYQFFDYSNPLEKDNGLGVMCTDTLGNQLWVKLLDGNYNSPILAAKLKDNSLLCVATGTGGTLGKFHLLHYLEDGQIVNNSYIPQTTNFLPDEPALTATSDGGFALIGKDISYLSNSALLKVGPSLKPACKTSSYSPYTQKSITFDEYSESVIPFGNSSTTSTISYSLSIFTSTVNGTCTSTCNTSASFLSSAGKICMNSSISFTNNSQNFLSSTWKVDGTTYATSSNFSYNFTSPGSHTVTLIATGSCPDSTKQVFFVDSLPDVNFTSSESELKVRLVPYQVHNCTQLTWNFGDGTPVNNYLDSVWHDYKETGTYNICLTATNLCGSKAVCKNVLVKADVSYKFFKVYDENSIYSGNQYGDCVVQASDGGFYLGGADDTYGSTGWDGIIMKFDTAGHPQWTRIVNFGTSTQQYIKSLATSYNGGVIFSGLGYWGNLHSFGSVDSTGYAWIKRFAVGSANDMPGNNLEMPDGRMICSGADAGGYLFTLAKNGALISYKKFSFLKSIVAIRRASSGFYYAFGNDVSGGDLVLLKLDSALNFMWAKNINPGTGQALAGTMQISKSGKIYMTGSFNTPGQQVIMLCADSAGNNLWTKTYNNVGQYGRSMVIDNNGNLYVSCSQYEYTAGAGQKALLKLDSLGNFKKGWYPNTSNLRIALTHDNGLAVAGTNYGFYATTNYNINLIKMDSTGLPACAGNTLVATPVNGTVITSVISGTIITTAPSFTTSYANLSYLTKDTTLCISSASALTASFTSNNTCVGAPVYFSNLSGGPVTSQQWTFSNGTPSVSTLQNPTVAWSTPGIYTVTLIVNSSSSSSSYTQAINIYSVPAISTAANPGFVCPGSTATLQATGANTFTWNTSQTGSSVTVNPANNTTYYVYGTDGNGCTGTNSIVVNTYSLPVLNVSSGNTLICSGQSATLSVNGASTYTWSTGSNSTVAVVTPTVTTTYSVSATSVAGCINSASYTQLVSPCMGVDPIYQKENLDVKIYPNPSAGEFTVFLTDLPEKFHLEVLNSIGQSIIRKDLSELNTSVNIQSYSQGIYFVKITGVSGTVYQQILIKE